MLQLALSKYHRDRQKSLVPPCLASHRAAHLNIVARNWPFYGPEIMKEDGKGREKGGDCSGGEIDAAGIAVTFYLVYCNG